MSDELPAMGELLSRRVPGVRWQLNGCSGGPRFPASLRLDAHGLTRMRGFIADAIADHPDRYLSTGYLAGVLPHLAVLAPALPQERSGTIANVVFPTGIARRDDLGMPDRFDGYYGMDDDRIGVARLDLPEVLPLGGLAHSPGAKV